MSKPRHLKIVPDGADKWKVLIGDIQIGIVQRLAGAFSLTVIRAGLTPGATRTMKEMREKLLEWVPQQTYLDILDEAYKAGYKG